jgi:hypothetical protein
MRMDALHEGLLRNTHVVHEPFGAHPSFLETLGMLNDTWASLLTTSPSQLQALGSGMECNNQSHLSRLKSHLPGP